MSVEKKLPDGWEVKRLGEVCELITKGTTPTSIGHKFCNKGVSFIKVESLSLDGQIITDKVAYISLACHEDLRRSQLQENDLLFSIAGALGRVGFVTKTILPANTNQALAIIRLKKDMPIDHVFLMHCLRSSIISSQIERFRGGVAQQNLSLGQLNEMLFPLPPLSEQKRIVAILDEAFQAIDRVKENAEKNLANAREVFDGYLNKVFSNPGKDWEEKKLGEVCDIKHGFAFDGKDFSISEDELKPIVLTPGNFTEDAKLLFNSKNTKRFSGSISTEWFFTKGELVVVMTDLSSKMKILGKPAIISQEKILHNQRIGRFLFSKKDIDLKLVYYFLQTKAYLDMIKETSTGTMVKHTAPKRILENRISFPKLYSDQCNIVRNLDNVFIENKRLESIYHKKIAALDELKKSIMQRAFSGKL